MMEKPKPKLVNLGKIHLKKIQKYAKYGDRSQFVRDAVDAFSGKFVPSEEDFKKKYPATCIRFFIKQLGKIAHNANAGARSAYIRAAVDAYTPPTK